MSQLPETLIEAQADLVATVAHNEVLIEALADIELAMEDKGWVRLGINADNEFSREGLRRNADIARVMAVANPLIRRGVQLKIAYVWGSGVSVSARAAGEAAGQDVNAAVQDFLDDPSNKAGLTSEQTREEYERALATDGNIFLTLFTEPVTGRVQVRAMPFDEILDVVNNPQDRKDPWFYLRQWTETVVEAGFAGTRSRRQTRKAYYPALGYRPRLRPRSIDGVDVRWDSPVLHVSVNRLDGWKFGLGDVFAALRWARAYEEFLVDWARLVKALSRYAWRFTGDKSKKVRDAVDKMRTLIPIETNSGGQAGATAAYGPGGHLEAIPKTGATIDSESGRPLAAMVAAALGVPVTMLLGDPGVTGARATAETLDRPTELEMGMRRNLWTSVLRRILDYVIEQAVKAPSAPLRGSVRLTRDGREVIELTGDVEKTVDIDWPDLSKLDPTRLVEAVVAADSTGKMPPLATVRLLLQALKVKDVDELLEVITDDDGNWIDPEATAGDEAVKQFHRGRDPAGSV